MSSGRATLYAGSGNDTVRGGAGADILLGDSGSDNLQGEDGDDQIDGGGGIDTINGGTGTDQGVTPAAGSPAMISIETVLANNTALLSAATAARQAWLTQFLATTDQTDDFIDRDEVINLVNSAQLRAEGGALEEDGTVSTLTMAQLTPIVEEATARWMVSGLSREQIATLAAIHFTITDLDGATIGLTDGTSVLIDRTAAGHEWFIDPTPQDNAEFHFVKGLTQWIADAHSPAFSRMDLLTTVMHEMGHVLGYDDQSAQQHRATLMSETLPTGVRRSLVTDRLIGEKSILPSRHQPTSDTATVSVQELSNRSLKTFAGAWGKNGTGNGSATPTKPVIDWTEIDEHDSRSKKGALGASSQKASWLPRLLFQMGREDATPHDHGIAVVLPGKKK